MIYALVTLYKPTEDVKRNISALQKQVDKVYLCDNSPNQNLSFSKLEKTEYVFFNENLGLSAAFNKILLNNNSFTDDDYIIFFDQDSYIEDNHIKTLINVYEYLMNNNIPIACVSPFFFNTSHNAVERPRITKKITENVYRVKSCITSSMLCKYKNLRAVGCWNEEIFLDMADWDLCWRMMKQGLQCFMTDKVILKHSLGNGEKRIGILRVRIGMPIREYYQTRDSLYLLKKSYMPFKFIIRSIIRLFIRPIIHFVLLPDRKKRFIYIRDAYKDFFRNYHGEYKK